MAFIDVSKTLAAAIDSLPVMYLTIFGVDWLTLHDLSFVNNAFFFFYVHLFIVTLYLPYFMFFFVMHACPRPSIKDWRDVLF